MNDLSRETPINPELEKKPIRIIHIEDNEQLRDLIGMELKKFPADIELVASFSSTEEAEEYLMRLRNEKKDLPDAIVSDNNLGGGRTTGIQFAKDLKEQGFEIPVVLFTGDTEPFKSISEEYLNAMGLTKVVDKVESTENLVSILKSIKPSIPSQDKPQ